MVFTNLVSYLSIALLVVSSFWQIRIWLSILAAQFTIKVYTTLCCYFGLTGYRPRTIPVRKSQICGNQSN